MPRERRIVIETSALPELFHPVENGGGVPGLYVHVPFCSAICPYCDFAVVKGRRPEEGEAYVGRLLEEASLWRVESRFDSLYLGGGTPSWLELEQLTRLVEGLRERLELVEECWLSMEVNPEDVDDHTLRHWRGLGVDFLSLGVQALDRTVLRRLGRRHSAEEARTAIRRALDAGFPVVSVDLIYAVPDLDDALWRATLEEVATLGVPHLSCYELTYHEGTPFGRAAERGQLRVLDEEVRARQFVVTHELLAELGYEGYEVSNFARTPSLRSPHNQKYWHHVPYLGLGVGAHSFDGRQRWWNQRDAGAWASAIDGRRRPVAEAERLSSEQLALESLMLELRTVEGVDLDRFERRFGVDLLERRAPTVARLSDAGLARVEAGHLRLSLVGRAVAESLAVELAP